ncbi:MAG: limonene-1,2-epoxide hydrolase [Candidatus Poriferisodalaceae bacterium]|jgi:limonene-1,2-epoxide hydrolase
MSSPSEIVNAFIAAIENMDIEAAGALAAEDISYENMPMKPIVGRDAMKTTLEGFLGVATEVDWPIISQVETGNRVINERVDRFKIGEGWLELPLVGIFEVNNDGLITLWRDYFDMGSYQRQMAKLNP